MQLPWNFINRNKKVPTPTATQRRNLLRYEVENAIRVLAPRTKNFRATRGRN